MPFGRPIAKLKTTDKAPMKRHEGGYYIRLMARDLAGTAATIATRLAEQKISIESIVQRHPDGTMNVLDKRGKPAPVPVILITYATTEDAVRRAPRHRREQAGRVRRSYASKRTDRVGSAGSTDMLVVRS